MADLELEWWMSGSEKARAEVTRIGLAHHIVTAFTSLVAVDTSRVVGEDTPDVVDTPSQAGDSVPVHVSRDSAGLSIAGTTSAGSESSATSRWSQTTC